MSAGLVAPVFTGFWRLSVILLVSLQSTGGVSSFDSRPGLSFGSPPCECVPAQLCPAASLHLDPFFQRYQCPSPADVCCVGVQHSRYSELGGPRDADVRLQQSHFGTSSSAATGGAGPAGGSYGAAAAVATETEERRGTESGCGLSADGQRWTAAVARADLDGLLFRCSGLLLSADTVLTVAHCVIGERLQLLRVLVGLQDLFQADRPESHSSPSVERSKVRDVLIHLGYRSSDQRHNLALLRLDSPMRSVVRGLTSPVCLPPEPASYPEGLAVSKCRAYSWGRDTVQYTDSSAPLLLMAVRLLPKFECARAFGAADRSPSNDKNFHLLKELRRSSGCVLPAQRSSSPLGRLCRLDPGSPVVCELDGRVTLMAAAAWATSCLGWNAETSVITVDALVHRSWLLSGLDHWPDVPGTDCTRHHVNRADCATVQPIRS